jgi:hypothetical protein
MKISLTLVWITIFILLADGSAFAGSFGLTSNDYGISFGNAPIVHGLRINIVDRNVERVDGINLTFWVPKGKTPILFLR